MKKSTFVWLVIVLVLPQLSAQNTNQPNVLFIAVDVLRPELGGYGQTHIKSPNIDKLAGSGPTFNRAYCNIPVRGASRSSILSGIRHNRNRFVNFDCWQDKDVPGVVSLPMHFKNIGYYIVSLGKIFHNITDGKGSWSETPWFPPGDWNGWQAYILPGSFKQIDSSKNNNGINGLSFESPDAPDHVYPDGMIAEEAIRRLREFNNSEQPFFPALGFLKPHLPFNAPKKYWDLYESDNIKLPGYMKKPKDAPDACMHNFGDYEYFGYLNPDQKTFANLLKEAGYASCIAGKWQLNGLNRNYKGNQDVNRPRHFGFDKYCLVQLTHGKNDGQRYADPLDMMAFTGRIIGQMESKLKEKGIWENTLFIFTADNGTHPPVFSSTNDTFEIKPLSDLTEGELILKNKFQSILDQKEKEFPVSLNDSAFKINH